MWIIYMCENLINGKLYIGKTIQRLSSRKAKHFSDARLGRDFKTNENGWPFYNAIRKYGKENFKWSIIQSIPEECKEALDNAEIFWIDYFDTQVPKGYNIEAGGNGHPGVKLTKEQREKRKGSRTGEKHYWSKESKDSVRESKYKKNKIKELNIQFDSIEALAEYLIENKYVKGKSKVIQSCISRVLK